MEMKEGRIAKLIGNSKAVINLGSNDGIRQGRVYRVYSMIDSIKDPNDDSDMGRFKYRKNLIEIIDVQEKMSLARCIERKDHGTDSVERRIMEAFRMFGESRYIDSEFDDVNVGDFIERVS